MDTTKKLALEALSAAANYIDTLGGDSKSLRIKIAALSTPAAADAPEPVAPTDAWCDAIADAHRWDTTIGRRAMIRAAIAASQPAPVAPFLARDAAELIGISVPDLSAALVALGMPERSQGMVIEPLEALAVSRKLAAPVEAQAVPEGEVPFDVWQERVACARVADAFAHESGPGPGRFAGNVISSRILQRTKGRVAAAPTPSKGEAE